MLNKHIRKVMTNKNMRIYLARSAAYTLIQFRCLLNEILIELHIKISESQAKLGYNKAIPSCGKVSVSADVL